MARKTSVPQKPKPRNFHAAAVLDPNGPYREQTIPNKLKKPVDKYGRKAKHRGKI